MLKKNNKTGFTLIELMVVIVIIGILATLGLVTYQNALRRTRNTKATGDAKDFAAAQEQVKSLIGNYVAVSSACAGNITTGYTGSISYNIPQHPKTGTSYSCISDTSGFCIAAPLDQEPGNCTACTSTTAFNTSGTPALNTSFCVVGKQ
jgi:prepilin-type N-terminal cleavage/methylation domain-containing protein